MFFYCSANKNCTLLNITKMNVWCIFRCCFTSNVWILTSGDIATRASGQDFQFGIFFLYISSRERIKELIIKQRFFFTIFISSLDIWIINNDWKMEERERENEKWFRLNEKTSIYQKTRFIVIDVCFNGFFSLHQFNSILGRFIKYLNWVLSDIMIYGNDFWLFYTTKCCYSSSQT